MSIKLYKSQLEPTAKSSNVANKAFVSMAEAGSIGRAWKGMVQSGEKLYAKHQDIKTDNEVLEKTKEVMNGSDKFEGLSATTLRASNMNDPDAAGKVYNDAWQNVFDNVNGSLSGKMAQRKFKAWMTKQNIKDVNDIKNSSTVNMINQRRVNTLDDIETLKKEIIHGTPLKSNLANQQLKENFSSQKFKEIFGNKLDGVVKSTETEIAWFQYKNVPIADQEAALAAAIKDKRIPNNEGKYSIQTLKAQFNSKKTTTNYLNKNNISSMESNMKKGYTINENEFAQAIKIASDTGDEKGLIKLSQMQIDYPIYQQLKTMSLAEIQNRVNILTEYKNTAKDGMQIADANNLEISKNYLDQLITSVDKDQLMTGHEQGVVSIDEIGFEKFLIDGNTDNFSEAITNRIAQAKTVANHYKRPVKFFTETELASIQAAYESATQPKDIINLSTALVKSFGFESDTAFKQITKDNTFLAHIGGLTMMNNGTPGANTKLAVQGYLISKNNPELSKMFKLKEAEISAKVDKYNQVFSNNTDTFNNIKEAANYIYQAQLFNKGESADNFNINDYEKAFTMASGATMMDIGIMGTVGFSATFGGYDEDTRGNMVYIPPWLKNGKFDEVIEMLASSDELFLKASDNGNPPLIGDGTKLGKNISRKEVFENRYPYFESVGNGKYYIAMGENPKTSGSQQEYLMNTDNKPFVININNIKPDILLKIK